jgi:heat-inducible transcriptional repressor
MIKGESIVLDQRKEKILKAIIDDYILTGIPVGSRTLSKREDIGVSSATIRNDMADLEDLGYLTQPHTSAGRIPSDLAYRLYVDKLMPMAQLSKKEALAISDIFDSKMMQINDVVEKTADVISKATNHISVVLAPQLKTAKVKRIQLVKLSATKVLVLIITSTGLVKQKVIKVVSEISEDYIEMLSHMLTQHLYEKTLLEAKEIINTVFKDEMLGHEKLFKSLLASIHDTAESHTKRDIILGGANNIFNYPEYRDIDRAKGFLEVLETKEMLYNMLNQASNLEFSISIGHENEFEQMQDCSIVTATYKIGDRKLGSFGVIGPTRMDYAKVVSILNHVSKSLNGVLDGFIDTKDE